MGGLRCSEVELEFFHEKATVNAGLTPTPHCVVYGVTEPQCRLQPSQQQGLFVASFSSQVHGVGCILCLTLLLRQLQEGKGRGLRAAARLISAKFSGCLPLALCYASSAPLAAWSYSSPWCIQILLGWISL